MRYSTQLYRVTAIAIVIAILVVVLFFLTFEKEGAQQERISENEPSETTVVSGEDDELEVEAPTSRLDVGKEAISAEEGEKREPLTRAEIKDILESGVDWFKDKQEENGHFKYEYILLTDEYADDDHIVRQMGALYILGEILKRDKEEVFDLKENVERAILYTRENTVSGRFNNYNFLCIIRGSDKCTLGGTALALVGVLDLVDAYPETLGRYRDLISGYSDFILAMKIPDKGFRASFYLTSNQTETESSFSNGEAFLALARFQGYSPTLKVKEILDNTFVYFDAVYREKWDPNFYLWGMAALKDLNSYEPKIEYVDFIRDYTNWRMEAFSGRRSSHRNLCAYIEGVVSAYSILELDVTGVEREKYLEEINFWLSKSKELQVDDSGLLSIFVGGEMETIPLKNPERAQGGFLTGLNSGELRQRIDFTQHCLSSYLQKQVDIGGEILTQM